MISVVIPTLNAQSHLPRCLESLVPATVRGLVREVIIADGGSTDGTLIIADGMGARVVSGPAARGGQLQAGADAARFDWLLFLNPVTSLEPGWDAEAEAFLDSVTLERPRAGAFRLSLDEFGTSARWMERLSALRAHLFALPYGNQGLLISKRHYRQTGGYRNVPMEDVDLIRRVGRRRLVMLRARAVTSRTHDRPQGIWRSIVSVFVPFLCTLRLPTSLVARIGG